MLSRRIRLFSVVLPLAALLGFAPTVLGANSLKSHPTMVATFNGRDLSGAEARKYHCHDGQPGKLQCFKSAERRSHDFRSERLRDSHTAAHAGGSTGYVIAYVHASYAGGSVILSQNYPNLTTIGWNDVISSYKVYAQSTGDFFEHAVYAGLVKSYCCFTNVPYVGDPYNDIFSSFQVP